MNWNSKHAKLLSQAFEKRIGIAPAPGTIAYTLCLDDEVVSRLAADPENFAPQGWPVFRVTDHNDETVRAITADRAVAIREAKEIPALFLVDTGAGAGMDGIYNSTRPVEEKKLFDAALKIATTEMNQDFKKFAEKAVIKARGGKKQNLSQWTVFDFYVRLLENSGHPCESLGILGLWPIAAPPDGAEVALLLLDDSKRFKEQLLDQVGAFKSLSERFDMLRISKTENSDEVLTRLEKFLHGHIGISLPTTMADLSAERDLWILSLKRESHDDKVKEIKITPWIGNNNNPRPWSGLSRGEEGEPPILQIDPNAVANGEYPQLEVQWKPTPGDMPKNSVQYRVALVTDIEGELLVQEVPHSGRKTGEKCKFTYDDLAVLGETPNLDAKIVVSVLDQESIYDDIEFRVRYGEAEAEESKSSGVGKIHRSLVEGVISLSDREAIKELAAQKDAFSVPDGKGFAVLRSSQKSKSFRVPVSPLIEELEQQWFNGDGRIGRWKMRIRTTGFRVGSPEFIPFSLESIEGTQNADLLCKVESESKKTASYLKDFGGSVGHLYDQQATTKFNTIRDYVTAWEQFLQDAPPLWTLANTLEIQSLSGKTLGLIVLPFHPLRVAWHVAYDNLVLHARFSTTKAGKQATAQEVVREMEMLDGSMFPAFLPGLKDGEAFLFGEMLDFHTAAMLPSHDKEPKATLSLLARALGGSTTPSTATQSIEFQAETLGSEFLKYVRCHMPRRQAAMDRETVNQLRINAFRPGDGSVVSRALGFMLKQQQRDEAKNEEKEDSSPPAAPLTFVLELYSEDRNNLVGRFITETGEKRRRSANSVPDADQWMFDSVEGNGMSIPRLRWAKIKGLEPKQSAHLAVIFDIFDTRVLVEAPQDDVFEEDKTPLYAFGLLSVLSRRYEASPGPQWRFSAQLHGEGEKHPAMAKHTDRLVRMFAVIQNATTRHLGAQVGAPVRFSELTETGEKSLASLHHSCDWVVTFDRNAGIEYFDSPGNDSDTFNKFIIDCVPEREDVGSLQLITSTSHLDEVQHLLEGVMGRMGLTQSPKNAESLLGHLKALSGRLAMRLAGKDFTALQNELVALAITHDFCGRATPGDVCWHSTRNGILIPLDDITDLFPFLKKAKQTSEEAPPAHRPDLIYVSISEKERMKPLVFTFLEVKYRQDLATARHPDLIKKIHAQLESFRLNWSNHYAPENNETFYALRRAKLARILRFYLDKARRHADPSIQRGLTEEAYGNILAEINQMVAKKDYKFGKNESLDRGWIFCPDFMNEQAERIPSDPSKPPVFIFGPSAVF